jgi:hypothetical protein
MIQFNGSDEPTIKDPYVLSLISSGVTGASLASHLADDTIHGDANTNLSSHSGDNTAHGDPIGLLTSLRGANNGLAELDAGGKVPSAQIPSIALGDVYEVADITARDALTVQAGDVAIVADNGSGVAESYVYGGSAWISLKSADGVISVAGKSGTVNLVKGDVGLGSVSNDAQLKIASNLADLGDAGTARTNLGLGSMATKVANFGEDSCGGSGVSTSVSVSGVLPTDTVIITPKGASTTALTRAGAQQVVLSAEAGTDAITLHHPADSTQDFYYQILR